MQAGDVYLKKSAMQLVTGATGEAPATHTKLTLSTRVATTRLNAATHCKTQGKEKTSGAYMCRRNMPP